MKSLLFIPSYNCENQIKRVLEKIKEYGSEHFHEIIVINNRSRDNTVSAAINAIKQLDLLKARVVTNSQNIGLGGTHKMAFQYAIENNFDNCIVLHGDDQGNIFDLKVLNNEKLNNKFFFGARFASASRLYGYSRVRTIGNIIFNKLASLVTGRSILDLGGSGLNSFPVHLIRQQHFWNYADDLTFHVYLLLNALKKNQEIAFFPISWREEDQLSNVKFFSQTKKLLRILIKSLLANEISDRTAKANRPDYCSWETH